MPVVVLGVVRQWVEYGVWSALIFVALLAVFLVLLLRLLAAKDRPGRTLDLLSLFFGFAAAASLTSAPFANTSTQGTGVAFSRHTALGSAAVSAIAAVVCWLLARRAGRRKRRATKPPG